MVDFKEKEEYNIDDLVKIMTILRSPEGCPWDREQNSQSIRNNILEESYEVVEAIDNSDYVLLCEELGDILLQVVFHSAINEAEGRFSFNDVVDGVCKKLILRHPHVFKGDVVTTADDVLKKWDEIKFKSKGQNELFDKLDSISKALPSLVKAQKIQKRLKNFGKDPVSVCDSIDIRENDDLLMTYGKELFLLSNKAYNDKIDCEEALQKFNNAIISEIKK